MESSLNAAREEPRVPYPGPRPFLVDEADLFFGRGKESIDLRHLMFSYRAVLLYAQSGAGKTSLLSAGVLPKLMPGSWTLARVAGELPKPGEHGPNVFVYNLLSTALGTQALGPETHLAHQLVRRQDEPWFLVLDQFEEVFTVYPDRWKEREPFFAQLKEALEEDRSLHVLLVIREEHAAKLDQFADYFPESLRIRYRLERLGAEAAYEAIVKPTIAYPAAAPIRPIASDLVRSLQRVPFQTREGHLVQIEGEFVEPVHLQVVCRDLWFRVLKANGRPLGKDFAAMADVDRVLTEFYEGALRRVAAAQRISEKRIRRWFEEELITPAGTRGIVYVDQRRGATGGIPTSVVQSLQHEHLLREEPRAGSIWYEIPHDRFIGPIRTSNLKFWRGRRRRSLVAVGIVAASLVGIVMYQLTARLESPNDAALANKLEATQRKIDETAQVLDQAGRALSDQSSAGSRAYAAAAVGLAQWNLGQQENARQSFALAIDLNGAEALKALDQAQTTASLSSDKLQEARAEFYKIAAEKWVNQVISEFEKGADDKANEALANLQGLDPRAVVPIFEAALASRTGKDSKALDLTRFARRTYLDGLRNVGDAQMQNYLCEHNKFVIASSPLPAKATQELQRWQRDYPHAILGGQSTRLPHLVPIILDYYLSADEAQELKNRVSRDTNGREKPFVMQPWGPPACE